MFTPYQIIAPVIAFIAIAYAWNLAFRQKKTIWEAVLWSVFWGAIIAISLYPESLDYLSRVTGIKDRENAVMVTFLGILLFIVFYLVIRLEALEQRQTKVIRGLALKELESKTHEDHSSH